MKPILAISILVATASSLPTKEKSASLPPPVSDKIYTFQQIEKQKAELKLVRYPRSLAPTLVALPSMSLLPIAPLKDKVVRIEIASLVAGPGDVLDDGTQRYIVEDTSGGVAPFGQVAFPREALEKMGLANDPHRKGPFIIYARIHVFPEKKAAAICVAVGTHVAVENGKATYSW